MAAGPVALGRGVAHAVLAQRGHLFPWTPVAMGVGIWVYFLLPVEPGPSAVLGVLALGVVAAVLTRPAGPVLGILAVALALGGGGFALAAWRTATVAAPVLDGRYYGPIEGRIVEIDRSARDVPRLTLDRVRLDGVAPENVPARVRVSAHGDQTWLPDEPGTVVMLTGFLSPPNGPMEPGSSISGAWPGSTGWARSAIPRRRSSRLRGRNRGRHWPSRGGGRCWPEA